jgi:hypothetical protein
VGVDVLVLLKFLSWAGAESDDCQCPIIIMCRIATSPGLYARDWSWPIFYLREELYCKEMWLVRLWLCVYNREWL